MTPLTGTKSRKTNIPKTKNTRKRAAVDLRVCNVLIIGVGNMGSALARGLSLSQTGNHDNPISFSILLYDPHCNSLDDVLLSGVKKPNQMRIADKLDKNLIRSQDVIVIATKPQDLSNVAQLLKGIVTPTTLIVSLLAAVTTDDIASALKFSGSIVRAMPNIAAKVLAAATALTANNHCSEDHRQMALTIFESVGTASWAKESQMEPVTGLSGSGPAYIYMVIEALTDGGVKMGLTRPLAHELACQTVLGSAKLVQMSGLHPAILKDQVTTPAGTTITAIHELEERGLRAMLMQAVATATERSAAIRRSSI